jgi:hypothetical protein
MRAVLDTCIYIDLRDAQGRLVTVAIRQFTDEIEKGVLISVDENRSRARLLPLG